MYFYICTKCRHLLTAYIERHSKMACNWLHEGCPFRFKLSDGLTIAVQDGDDEEKKKKATAAGQWAQYDWSTKHGKTGILCKACAHLPPVSPHSIINMKMIKTPCNVKHLPCLFLLIQTHGVAVVHGFCLVMVAASVGFIATSAFS